ncbi:MAG: HEAT repeat domain-containing protein [Pirellulales bacterium]|nr:HEAT repeat domain-containing protein [Pirellulales bacterium]
MQREYARLAQLLNSTDHFGKREAAETLLRVRPSDVENLETRKLIARGYRALASEGNAFEKEDAIRGLVIWGGKFSTPILIELMEKENVRVSDELFSALGQLKDPKGAEAVARHLGNVFNHDGAVNSLRRMGPVAEDALIKAAPSQDPDVSLAAIQLLGEVGSEKSNSILQRASSARNPQVKAAARDAIAKIRLRKKNGTVVGNEPAVDPNSPFAEGSGPAVDITARNTSNFAGLGPAAPEFGSGMGRGRARPGGMPGATNDEAAAEEVDLNEGDWSQVNALLPGDPAGDGLTPDPQQNALAADAKPQPTRLGNEQSQAERPTSIHVAGNQPLAAVLHCDPFKKSLARLEVLDLQKRRSIATNSILGGGQRVRFSPSATRLAIYSDQMAFRTVGRIDLYSLANGRTTELVNWAPYATSKDHFAGIIDWLEWVDEDNLLILNGQGQLVLWRIEEKKPRAIFQLDAIRGSVPALSPGRAQFAMASGRGVEVFRSSDGELLARFTVPGRLAGGLLAYNSDGTKLAIVSGGNVFVWGASTGKLLNDFYCLGLGKGLGLVLGPGQGVNAGSLEWLDDHHLLVGGQDIIDLDRRLVAWRYESGELPGYSHGGWRWLVMQSGNAKGIVPAKLLQPEVLEPAAALDAESILALKPGAKIALEVSLGGEEQARGESTLRKCIEENGMEVSPDSPIRLRAQIVTGKSETKEYGSHIFRSDNEQVTTTEKRFEVELLVDGQPIWRHLALMQSANGPGLIVTHGGESAQQALDRDNTARAAGFNFSVSLPRYVVQPKYAGPLGTSKLSLGGP